MLKNNTNLEQVNGAKSLSFVYKGDNPTFDKNMLLDFKELLKTEKTFRVLLHSSSQANLHNMIIAMDSSKFVYPHKHNKSETYQIIDGELLLIYFNDNGSINKFIKLSKNDTFISRVDSGYYHGAIPLTKNVIFHEMRTGPFNPSGDSCFANWIEGDKDIYMNKILEKYKEIS